MCFCQKPVEGRDNGFFKRPNTLNSPGKVVTADLDRDGDHDLTASNRLANSVSVFLNNGNATFEPKVDYTTSTNPLGLINADVDFGGFLAFVRAFETANAVFDLDGNDQVDFTDFLLFVQSFGKSVN